jgi:hypothetical protein
MTVSPTSTEMLGLWRARPSYALPQNHELGQALQPGGRALPTYAEAGDAEAAAFAEGEDADTTKLLIAGYIPFRNK